MNEPVLHKKTFQELSTDELYELLRVRSEVFVVEQNCVYQDMDGDDQKSIHLWLTVADKIVALARVCPAGTHMKEFSIGRVITTERGKGYGKQIMLHAIDAAIEHFDTTLIDIEAQEYARGFYESVGFKQSSDTFMLDGIPHIKMTWNKYETMKKIINPWRNHEGYNCFGCSPDNPIGLHMEFYEDGDYIVSSWHPEHNYQGWVDTMHGGILSTLIDEVCGWVVTRKLQTSGYTVQLNVKFRKAVPTTEPELTIRAKVTKQVRNLAYISAEITNSKGELCNEGEAIYFLMNEEKAKEMGFLHCEVEE